MLRLILWLTVVASVAWALSVELDSSAEAASGPRADPHGARLYRVHGWEVKEFRDTHGRVCTFITDTSLDCEFPPGALGVER